METTVFNNLLGMGVGGALAAVVLFWKRQDDQRYAKEMKDVAERSIASQEKTNAALQQVALAIEKLCTLQKIEERLQAVEKQLSTRSRAKRGDETE